MTAWNAVFCLLLASSPAQNSDASSGVVFSPQRAFRIPLEVAPEERAELSAVRLYVSEDQGRTWTRHGDGAPTAEVITFRAKRDGEFWFSIALVDLQGRQSPEDVRTSGPGLKVVVDTTKPVVDLRAIRSKSGKRGVRWTVDDAGFLESAMRLAVWDEASQAWSPCEMRHPEKGMEWFDESASIRKVQASVFDRAGNESIVELDIVGDQFSKRDVPSFALDERKSADQLVASATGRGSESMVQPVGHVVPETIPSKSATICGSKQVVVNYVVDEATAKPNRVELWATRNDGDTWALFGVDADGKSPAEATLNGDGVWGLRIVMADSNLPSPGPTSGTEPEMYIDIDSVSPEVRITDVHAADGRIRVAWTLAERNPTDQPIDVSVATSPEGPWECVAANLKNTGEHEFLPPQGAALTSLFVKIEAHDRAGHTGSAQTSQPVGSRMAK